MIQKLVMSGCLLLGLLLTGCGPSKAEKEAASLSATMTAYSFISMLTQTAEAGAIPPTATTAPTFTASALPPTPTVPPPATATPAPTQTKSGATISQCDAAGFISETVPDKTVVEPGKTFTKTWTLINAGTCTWSSSYQLVFYNGSQMGGPATQPLTTVTVAPGASVILSVNLTAPTSAGTYTGNWVLRNASGVNFGIGSNGAPFWVQIVVSGSVTATPTGTRMTATPTDNVDETSAPEPTSKPATATPTTAPTITPKPSEEATAEP